MNCDELNCGRYGDVTDYVHCPQDPRSPGRPAFDPSWSLGWLLPPPWWASCAVWRTMRWANVARALQRNIAMMSTPLKKQNGDVSPPWVWSCLSAAWVKAAARPSAPRAPSGVCLRTRPWRCEPSDAADRESSAPRSTGSLGTWEGGVTVKKHHVGTTGIWMETYRPEEWNAFDAVLTRT